MKIKKLLALTLALSLLGIAGCSNKQEPAPEKGAAEQTETAKPTATPEATEKPESTEDAKATEETTESNDDIIKIAITLTDGRTMKGELYPEIAPISVANFVKLAEENFFDGLIFHRVIEGFMIQGGGYDDTFYKGNFNTKETDSIKGEFTANGFENNLKHTRGVLSMARTQEPNSASSQFFIMHQDYPSLNGQYAAFGRITEGLEVVDEIAGAKTTALRGTVTVDGQQYPTQMTDIPEKITMIKSIDIIK